VRQQILTEEELAYYCELTAISCTADEDRTRQEFAQEVDVNVIMRNLAGIPFKPVTYGEVDFDNLDRKTIEDQARAASELYASLTPEQQAAIPSVAHLVEMAAQGFQPPPRAEARRAPSDTSTQETAEDGNP